MGVYNNYAERLSKQIEARFAEIEAVHNFEFGYEFEIAVCQLLTSILPDKYGVCRGFIVSHGGEREGDDVIIYDKLSFPLIRQHSITDFSLKQQVPIEAVYAYIECKISINDQETLDKAISQVTKVKKLLLTRELKANPEYDADGPIFWNKTRNWPRQQPMFINQPFTMILTRMWNEDLIIKVESSENCPDLFLLGSNHFASQLINLGPDGPKGALFFDSKHVAKHTIEKSSGKSYGIGMVMLFQALSMIKLLPINWFDSLNSELSPFN